MQNPFLYIVPSENEQIVNRERETAELHLAINKFLKLGGGVIVVKGAPGMGKTSLVKFVLNSLKNEPGIKTAYFELDTLSLERLNELNIDPKYKYVIAIDDINNEEGFTPMQKARLRDLILKLASKVCLIVIENREKGIDKDLPQDRKEIVEIGGMPLQDIKQIIINRLNKIRNQPSNSIEPFKEKDIESAYRKSSGNIRMILLILAALFDRLQEK
jgi:predicted ATPase